MTRPPVYAALLLPCLLCHPALAATTERISVGSAGLQALSGESEYPSVSADGRFVAFQSNATNLVAGDTNLETDVFVRDRLAGVTQRVSVHSDGAQADGVSQEPSISADGRYVAFASNATNLIAGDTNGDVDIFVRDREESTTERVSIGNAGSQANSWSASSSISADGRFVAFQSNATNLVADDTNGVADIFVRDRVTGTTERISVDSAGAQAVGKHSRWPRISADGRFVTFESEAANLVANDTNGLVDIFVHDRQSGATERVNVGNGGVQANGASAIPAISADGRFVTFESHASNLVANDTNSDWDVFVRDRLSGTTQLVSVDSSGGQADSSSFTASINADGRFVVFVSDASNLVAGDTNGARDLFVRDRLKGVTTRVSIDGLGNQGNGDSYGSSLSADGRFVAFDSEATNLVAGDTNTADDIFVRDGGLPPDGNDDVLAVFGTAGTWQRLNDTSWQKIHNASPLAIASGDLDGSLLDEAIMSFAGAGLWARYDNATWKKLHNATPARFATGDLDGNGSDELIVDFGGAGLWVLRNNTTWAKIHNATTQDLATGDFDGNGKDELVVDFGAAGLWARYNDATWAKLHNATPARFVTGDLDGNGRAELIADFGAAGISVRYNNATWTKRHNDTSQGLATGDLDGDSREELIADFGAQGLWVFYDNSAWVKRHNASPQHMIATDLDGNSKSEIVVDFGAAGLWVRYNNANWTQIHNATTQGLAAGGLD